MKVVDMHCDTISQLFRIKKEKQEAFLRQNHLHVDLEKMKAGDYLLQNFALFVDRKQCKDPWEEVLELLYLYNRELEQNNDCIAPVRQFADIRKNQEQGLLSALLTVEEGGVCKGELQNLHYLYDKGVRMMTLTWNYPNELGYPNIHGNTQEALYIPDEVHGLTEKGIAFVEEMERLGMMIDVSHLSDAGFQDVLTYTRKPFVASHSNARAVCACVRNLTDAMIRQIGERGGVIGLNFCQDFLQMPIPGKKNQGTLETVVRHAKHMIQVGGIACVGFGSDFDGIPTHEQLPCADRMPLLDHAMAQAGLTEGEREKIFSGNVLRVYKEVL